MYDSLTAAELVEWETAYALDPWGPEREEMLHGVLCNLIDACHRTSGQPEPPLRYMPFVSALAERPRMTDEDMKAIWKSAVAAWGS